MDALNHYHIYGIEEKCFRPSGEIIIVENYATLQRQESNYFTSCIIAKDRKTEGIDRGALEELAHDVVAHQVKERKTRSFAEKDITLAFTFKPAYDAVVGADGEQRMFELSPQERVLFTAYARTE